METYSSADARKLFAELIGKAAHGDQRFAITRNGKNAAAIVPYSDLELLAEIERIVDVAEARKALAEAKKKGTVGLDDLRDLLD